jgi:hypothetical protein
MKNILSLILLTQLFVLVGCSKEETTDVKATTKDVIKKVEKKVENKIEAKTITLKEVSRIALVEAKQFIEVAKEKAPTFDITKANELYQKAESLFNEGEYKQAQKVAVDVRHTVEEILIEAKKKLVK